MPGATRIVLAIIAAFSMKGDRCVKGMTQPAAMASGVGVDSAMFFDTGKHGDTIKPKTQNRRMKANRKVLEELQAEANELLSLTYGLNITPTTKPTQTKKLLEEPKLNNSSDSRNATNAKWQEELPPKTCKLIPSPELTKACTTEKVLTVKTDDPKKNNNASLKSVDVISPIQHLAKAVSYPLDLSINDFSQSAPLVLNATRESYREMLVALQQKYTIILRKFEEINEQRMSYIEGIHELQGHLDNARSVMQLQRAEITRLQARVDTCETLVQSAAEEVRQANAALSEQIQRASMLENEIRDKRECIDSMTAEMTTMKANIATLTQEMKNKSCMPPIIGNATFRDKQYTYEDALKELDELLKNLCVVDLTEEKLDEMVARNAQGTGPLRYLETLISFPITNRLTDFYRQRFIIADKFKQELMAIQEDKERELKRNHEITQQLVDTYAARVHQANAQSLSVRRMLDNMTRRSSWKPITNEMNNKMTEKITKQLRSPIPVMFFDKPIMGKPYFREFSLRVMNQNVQIGHIKGNKFVPKHTFPVPDIHKVEFGFTSTCYILHAESIKKTEVYPWQFFTITTLQRQYHMVCTTDALLDVLVVGLNRMIAAKRFMVDVIDISRMRLLRAMMRLHYHCHKNKISYRTMWLNAIKKTIAERNLSR